MDHDNNGGQETVMLYRREIADILRYIPWLQEKEGGTAVKNYENDKLLGHSMTFPVYDSTLLSLVKTLQKTQIMDRNYAYVYSRNQLRTTQDELYFIDHATIRDLTDIGGILSKYVIGGMTKGGLWNEAVEKGVFLHALLKMKDLLDFWDKPLA